MSWGRRLMRLVMKQACIAEAETLAEGFRLLTLDSPGFTGVPWVPGQKLQVAMGSAFVARTFTPIDWEAARGRTRILGYAHGQGPGSAWLRAAAPGDACDIFGPRASLDLRDAARPVVIGDETSIGLAHALVRHHRATPLRCLLEAKAAGPVREVLARLDLLAHAEVFERRGGDAHLGDMARRLPALADAGATFVLTGQASSIQGLRRALKAAGVPSARVMAKAYWAPGKTGLD